MTRRSIVVAMCATVLATAGGCAPPVTHRMTTPFDAAQAKTMLAPGINTITGSAVMRQQGGGVVTCAGVEVNLLPATPYAIERMRRNYGSDQKGYRGIMQGVVKFQPDPPEYYTALRTVIGDAQGMFQFDSVGDGDYFVITAITWTPGYIPQGGALMQRVSVSGGETKRVVLSP